MPDPPTEVKVTPVEEKPAVSLSPEKQTPSREEVIQALDQSFGAYKASIQGLIRKADEANQSLTPQEQRRLFDFQATKIGKEKMQGKKGKDFFQTFSHEGEDYQQKEGIPVDGLIGFLSGEVTRLSQGIPDLEATAKIAEYKGYLEILNNHSQAFAEAHKKNFNNTDFMHARTEFEAQNFFRYGKNLKLTEQQRRIGVKLKI